MNFLYKCPVCQSITKEEQDIVGQCENQTCPKYLQTVKIKDDKPETQTIDVKRDGKKIIITIEVV